MTTAAGSFNNDIMTTPQRWLEWLIVALLIGLLAFLLYHQAAQTGFFNDKFGVLEMICLYGPLLLAMVAPSMRAITGERNPSRLLEAAANLSVALGAIWLLYVFPFDFTHLADALPEPVRFALAWTTDGFGKVILVLQIVLSPLTAIATLWKYFTSS